MKRIMFILFGLAFVVPAFATGVAEGTTEVSAATIFFWVAILLIFAKLASLIERIGQPSVLGELIMGVILGNLGLLGLHFFEQIRENSIITFLGELGVVILLFQIGLESNLQRMSKVGVRAFMVAIVGVVAPFVLGAYIVGPWLMPNLDSNTYLFLGAALTATSVGITARVFKDLGKLQTPEAQIVLGAAVIDDVLGLIILAVVSAMVTAGSVSLGLIGWIAGKAILFLVGSVVIGQLVAPHLGHVFSKIHSGVGMKLTLALCFGLITAYLAEVIGLAPIVGAFAAGLVLDPVHFQHFKKPTMSDDVRSLLERDCSPALREEVIKTLSSHEHRHVEDLIEPIAHFLVPLFFILTGMEVRLETLFNGPVILVALGITVVAFAGKIVSGLVAGPVRKSIVGWGMVPRGEVGLIFAAIGKSLGVVNDSVFSVIVIMVILTTLFTPPILTFVLKRAK